MNKPVLLVAGMMFLLLSAAAQTQQQERMGRPPDVVVGKVTAVSENSVTIAPVKGGDSVVVKIDDRTRVMKERQPTKLSEVKVNDTVMAGGKLDGNTLQAVMLGVMSPEMAQRVQQGGGVIMGFGGGGPGGRMPFNPEDWGKTFVAGRVKAINETTLTIARPDGDQTLNIEVDENTSFRKGRESITLADIKADDFVVGQGEVKNGVFVVKELRIGSGRMFQGRPDGPGTPPDSKPQPKN